MFQEVAESGITCGDRVSKFGEGEYASKELGGSRDFIAQGLQLDLRRRAGDRGRECLGFLSNIRQFH